MKTCWFPEIVRLSTRVRSQGKRFNGTINERLDEDDGGLRCLSYASDCEEGDGLNVVDVVVEEKRAEKGVEPESAFFGG